MVDKRDLLGEEIFISWHGKQVVILSSNRAKQFLEDITDADAKKVQLILAKTTGIFKRANEKRTNNN